MLRRLFGWFVLVMAVVIGAQEAPTTAWSWVVVGAGALIVMVTWATIGRGKAARTVPM